MVNYCLEFLDYSLRTKIINDPVDKMLQLTTGFVLLDSSVRISYPCEQVMLYCIKNTSSSFS